MAVVASFTYVQTGSLSVAFTDTSTGSPNKWLWDFGDGFTSNDQNPTHTYAAHAVYTVTLKAFIQTGSNIVTESFSSGRSKSGSGGSDTAAFNNFIAASWTNHPPGSTGLFYKIQFLGNFVVSAGEATYSYDLSAYPSGVAELQVQFSTIPNPSDSVVKTGSGKIISAETHNVWLPVEDVTVELGDTFFESWLDATGYTFGGLEFSSAGTRVQVWTATDIDTDSQSVTVRALEVDFVGTPVFGDNVQAVQFTDLSDGGVTVWKWRKRKAGTNDAFIEFATTKNPLHNFDKDNP